MTNKVWRTSDESDVLIDELIQFAIDKHDDCYDGWAYCKCDLAKLIRKSGGN